MTRLCDFTRSYTAWCRECSAWTDYNVATVKEARRAALKSGKYRMVEGALLCEVCAGTKKGVIWPKGGRPKF